MNRVEITGRLARDAELHYTPNGTPVLTIAVEPDVRRAAVDKTSFVDVVQFGGQAEDGARLKKGQNVSVIGRLEQERWTDNEGRVRSKVRIVARVIDEED